MKHGKVYNFVKSCIGFKRLEFWEDLTLEEENAIIEIAEPEILDAFLEPEKYNLKKLEGKIPALELVEKHKECGFDAFLYNRISNFSRYETTKDIRSFQKFIQKKEEVFFQSENAFPEKKLRILKSSKNYAKRISEFLEEENLNVFLELNANALGCFVQSFLGENLFFPLEKMNLIPSFVRWRNKNLLQWIMDSVNTREERAYEQFEKNLLNEELEEASKDISRSFYEKFEDRVRSLFEMMPEYKVNLIQQTVDLTPETFLDFKKIILLRYVDSSSFLKPEIEVSLSIDDFERDFSNLKEKLERKN